MGTRSRIGVMHGDKLKSVYCHWDGYLEHNGRILQEHYDSAKANQLVGTLCRQGGKVFDPISPNRCGQHTCQPQATCFHPGSNGHEGSPL